MCRCVPECMYVYRVLSEVRVGHWIWTWVLCMSCWANSPSPLWHFQAHFLLTLLPCPPPPPTCVLVPLPPCLRAPHIVPSHIVSYPRNYAHCYVTHTNIPARHRIQSVFYLSFRAWIISVLYFIYLFTVVPILPCEFVTERTPVLFIFSLWVLGFYFRSLLEFFGCDRLVVLAESLLL
jgi:hypothetical protein